MLWTIFKYENKQRAITQKLSKQELLSCVVQSPLIRSIHQRNLITIAGKVFEICSGQNSSTKNNKGQ